MEYKAIPGYDCYSVTECGKIKSNVRDILLSQYLFNGYLIVDTFRGSLTETLPVHRAVALAWIENPEPDKFKIVNHLDGDPINNHKSNLEWTDYSGNNYHAVNNGLRTDNFVCFVRDYYTKEVTKFASSSQASTFMGYDHNLPICMLKPKKFGALINGKYEFKFDGDTEPWFYENRTLIIPARYLVSVYEDGKLVEEITSQSSLLKAYQLYRCKSHSIPAMVDYANKLYSHLTFEIKDSYVEDNRFIVSKERVSQAIPIIATGPEKLTFKSLTACARHFKVDRSTILNRLNNGKCFGEWMFNSQPAYPVTDK